MVTNREISVGVIGATGAVGRELIEILDENTDLKIKEIHFFASPRSVGKTIEFDGKPIAVEALSAESLAGLDIVFMDVADELALEWGPIAAEQGCWVIDNSAAFRDGESNVIVVPEINADLIVKRVREAKTDARARILAGPNCSTAQLVMALYPMHKNWKLKRVIVSTYQSASGAGQAAVEEVQAQSIAITKGESPKVSALAHNLGFNCIHHIGGFDSTGFSSEERKIRSETRKILDLSNLAIQATAVRVPTLRCHAESVCVELETAGVSEDDLRAVFNTMPGVKVVDDLGDLVYPMPYHCAKSNEVYVGRIRKDLDFDSVFHFWVVSDNLRKGAAWNAYQIARELVSLL